MVPGPHHYAFASRDGIFEPCHVVGEEVCERGTLGRSHLVDKLESAPIEVRYGASGVLWMSAGLGRVQPATSSAWSWPSTTRRRCGA